MTKRKEQIFWGWYVVLGAFLVLGLSNGLRYSFAVFVRPMFQEYGLPMSVISLMASLNLLLYSIGGVFCGRLVDRIAPRWLMTAGSILTAAGLALLTRAETSIGLCFTYGILCGCGQACIGAVVCTTAVGKWFNRKRGFALGLSTMGIGVGTMVLSPVAGYIVSSYDWRTGFLFFGALVLVAGSLIAQFLMGKASPEASGLLPDGDPATGEGAAPSGTPPPSERPPLKPVLCDTRFWLLSFCNCLATLTLMMTFVHQVAYATGNQIGKVEAATALGIMGLAGSTGKVFFGWLCDRIPDAKHAAALGYACMAVGTVLLMAADSAIVLYLFAACYGFGYGSMAPVVPYLITDRFGRQVLGSAYGVMMFFGNGIGGGTGPVLGGFIYDRTGSYANAWLLNLILLTVVTVLILALKPARVHEVAR